MSVPLEIDCQTVKRKQDAGDSFLFLDCREPHEADVAKTPGTLLIPMSELANRLSELDAYKSGEVIVHCHHGVGRAPLMGGCILVDQGTNPVDAMELIKSHRWQASPNEEQLNALIQYAERHTPAEAADAQDDSRA